MFTQIREPDPHFSAFYEDNSILIQFILEEFIHSYLLTSQIRTLIQNRADPNQAFDALPPSLVEILGRLVGSLPHNESSRWTKGHLVKFKEYCDQYSRNSAHQNKQHAHLHMAAHQALQTAIHNLELLNSLHINPQHQKDDIAILLLPVRRALHTLQIRFDQICRYLPRIVSTYWNNENVILCLLRKRGLLSEIYGDNFLFKRFKWPIKSFPELFRLLVQRYEARGFEALLPTIQQLYQVEDATHDAL
jgi:hypothetical protein